MTHEDLDIAPRQLRRRPAGGRPLFRRDGLSGAAAPVRQRGGQRAGPARRRARRRGRRGAGDERRGPPPRCPPDPRGDPSGLDDPGQFTSAYDLALIARVCFADPTFRRYALTEQARIPAQPALRRQGFQIQNENQLIYRYPGALGGKTGFTDYARHTYVGAAQCGGRRLVVTLLGAEPRPMRGWEQGAALLDWGFSLPRDASVGRLVDPGETAANGAPVASPAVGAAVTPEPRAVAAHGVARPGWAASWPFVAAAAAVAGLLAAVLLHRRRRRA
ncbi:serine-type D-Ala-D-Ala carboxypeptidase [Micromonospora sp. ATCC 39149]|nr:serine-type D-Ala-D-Ala carboxypeptidase [Micromonospora sp. ATCC 39149]